MRRTSRAAVCLLSLVLVGSVPAAEDPRRRPATSWDLRLAPPGERGDPFEMSGVVRNSAGQGFVNVRQDGRPAPTPERSYVAKRGADGVWLLAIDLRPGWSGPPGYSTGRGSSWYRPFPAADSDAWAPDPSLRTGARRDTSGAGKRK